MAEPKRRGRPKKINEPVKLINREIKKEENQIILHLPIRISDLDEKKMVNKEKKDNLDLRIIQLKVPVIKIKDNEVIVDNPTNIVCWWCTYNFSNIPCFLPDDYIDGKFYVLGCFCSFNCAVSYNFSLNDYKVWNRYSLLNKMYQMMYHKYEHLRMAPQREVLDKFGGTIKIDEFRKSSICNMIEYRLVLPPMIPIIPFIEINYTRNK